MTGRVGYGLAQYVVLLFLLPSPNEFYEKSISFDLLSYATIRGKHILCISTFEAALKIEVPH